MPGLFVFADLAFLGHHKRHANFPGTGTTYNGDRVYQGLTLRRRFLLIFLEISLAGEKAVDIS
jgi:hypothetical protein